MKKVIVTGFSKSAIQYMQNTIKLLESKGFNIFPSECIETEYIDSWGLPRIKWPDGRMTSQFYFTVEIPKA